MQLAHFNRSSCEYIGGILDRSCVSNVRVRGSNHQHFFGSEWTRPNPGQFMLDAHARTQAADHD